MSPRTGWRYNASRKRPSHVASTPEVTVYHADGCHLCERALEQVRQLRDELGYTLREVDITGDDALEAAYRMWIPVVEVDGRRVFTYYVHDDALRRAVAQAASES
ncbi:MAG: glutaredoxin family protein [Actinomycetota bacterium]